MRGVMRGRGTSLFTRRIRVGYAPLSRGDVRATTGVLFSLGDGRLWTHSGSPFVSNRLVARSLYSHSPSQCKRSVPPLPSQNSDVASQVRTVATTDDSMSTSTDNQHFISNEGGDDHMQHHEPFTGHQQRLLEYTRSILPDAATCPVGTLSYSKLVQISNCIDQWISSGEHRYLGAEQAELLLKRLIVERGGGRSRWAAGGDAGGEKEELYKRMNLQGHASDGRSTTLRRNEDVTWHMYNFPSIVRYLNALYTGKDFVNRILSIVALFEEEFADDDSHGSDARPLEVRYKYMITCLCDCRTPHAASAAEHVLHSFESRLRGNPGYHSNPPTVETYNNVMSCWNKAQCTRYPPGMGPPGYFHHPNPCSNLLCHMLEQFDANAANMAWIKPDFLSFNTAITSLAAEQIDHTWRRGDGSGDNYQHTIGRQCHAHLMSMLELYDDGHPRCTPDLITFSTVLNTLGRGRDEGDATRAQEVLDAMLRLSGKQDGDDGGAVFEYDIVPRTRHFNIVLSLMAHAPKDSRRETLSRAERYVSIMERLGEREKEDRTTTNLPQTHNEIPVEERHVGKVDLDDETLLSMTSSAPNVITYNTLLNIAGQAGQPQKAQYILESMMKNAHIAEARAVKPDIISFNTVLLAWSKSRGMEGKIKTEQLLHQMQEMADKGDTSLRPDRTSLTTIITALTSSARHNKSAVDQTEKIIHRMETNEESDMRPDVVTYTSLIKCWIQSGRSGAGDRAEEIVNFLHQRYKEGYTECKPDAVLYNVAIDALAKSESPNSGERAEALLNRMLDHYYAGDADLTPNTLSKSCW